MQFEPAKTFERLEPLTIPNLKPIETDLVSKKQSLYEWGMAGGGVPLEYKDREHEWHAMVNKHEAKMAGGGLLKKAIQGVQKVLPAAEREANLAKFLAKSQVTEPVFHAAKTDVKQFSPKRRTELSSMGHHFGTAEQANFRTGQYDFDSKTPNIGKYHLNIENPLEVSHMASFAPDHLAEQLMDMNLLKPSAYDALSEKHGYDSVAIGEELARVLQKNGYDGLKYMNEKEGEGFSYVPLRPTQIKSATGNRGTYDTSSPDLNEAKGGLIHLKKGGDPRKRAMFPKMSTQAIMESPGFDPEIPSDLSRAYARRMSEKDAYERSMRDQKLTPSQRATAALETAGMLGSAAFEGIQQLPKLLDGEDAYSSAVGSRMYQPRFQPEKAGEYAGNVVDFLEQLETKYKVPQVIPELLPFTTAANVAKSQAQGTAKKAVSGLDVLKGSKSEPRGMAGQRGVVKMPGGNFLTGRVEKDVSGLKTRTVAGETPAQRIPKHEELLKDPSLNQDQIDRVKYQLEETKKEAALDKWVDSNLSGYIKNQMGTPDDPVRLMFDKRTQEIDDKYAKEIKKSERIAQKASEEPDPRKQAYLMRDAERIKTEANMERSLAVDHITHNQAFITDPPPLTEPTMTEIREKAGFPAEGMGQSPMAKAWEFRADASIAPHRAGDIQEMPEKYAKMEEAERKMQSARRALDEKFINHVKNSGSGLSDQEQAMVVSKTPYISKARTVGDKDYLEADAAYRATQEPMMESYMQLARENPWISKLDPETPIHSSYTSELGFDHIMDVLREDLTTGRIRPEQLNKVSITDAVRRTSQYDQEMAKKMAEARTASRQGLPLYKEYPEGYKWIELNKPGAFAQESEAMGHSVRGYEPPKGHPDWTEGSGDSGSSSYGHGGWEAIKSGKAKVYSLVDPKGAPHATVEVKHPQEISDDLRYKHKDKINDRISDYFMDNPDATYEEAMESVLAGMKNDFPPSITQIKGKQNRAPNEDYLPYVQDFVKSGKWSDIGDLQNTGMRATKSVFNDAELQMLREAGETNIPPALLGEDIQRLHNLIVPEGKRLKYSPQGNIIGSEGDFAHGGEVHMAGGGLLKKAVKSATKAPTIIIPSKVSSVKEAVRQSKGDYGARRVERAADEIPNLEKLYKEEALKQAFEGDNAKPLMTMNPADFEKYAIGLPTRTVTEPRSFGDKTRMSTEDYLKYLRTLPEGFDDVPFLEINKQEQGLPLMPFISGHEGRHRNRAMAESGEQSGLVRLFPRAELREGFPRRSQEEYIEALKKELEMTGNLVLPEHNRYNPTNVQRPAIKLPDIYAKGGEVHMGKGGVLKKFIGASDVPKGVEPIVVKAKPDHPLVFPRAAPKTKEDIRPMAQRMAEQMSGEFVRQNPKVTTNPAGKSRKQFKREQEIPLETRRLTEEKEVPFVDYESKKGHVLLGVPGDPTLGGVAKRGTLEEVARPTVELTRVGDITPEYPVPLFGGPRYGNDERFWASNYGAAAPIQNSTNELAKMFEVPVMGQYIKMAPDSANFALHNLDALLSIQQPERLNKGARNELNKLIKQGSPKYGKFPGFAGVEDPQDVLLQAQMNSKLRKHIAEILTKPTITEKLGLPNGLDVVAAITHPALRNLETGTSGFSIGELRHGSDLKQWRGEHPTYDTDIPGSLIGQSRYPIPAEIAFPDTMSYARSQMTPGVQEFNMMKMLGPRERIDQQYIDEIKMYEELMKEYTGKKKGGSVTKPKKPKSPQLHD